jgi:threonine/homoserine/homoserine lactone efflux protein
MDLITLLLFIPACFALNMSPGPNNLLAMSNAKRYGFRIAFCAGLGRLTAFTGMIILTATGLAVILHTSEAVFMVIKIGGAGYLFWLAFKLWTSDPSEDETLGPDDKSLLSLAQQELFLAAGNPKAILIFTAFLPQFVNPDGQTNLQFFELGLAFIILEGIAIAAYALFGLYLRQWFSQPHTRQLFNRSCAALLATAGAGLLLARK